MTMLRHHAALIQRGYTAGGRRARPRDHLYREELQQLVSPHRAAAITPTCRPPAIGAAEATWTAIYWPRWTGQWPTDAPIPCDGPRCQVCVHQNRPGSIRGEFGSFRVEIFRSG
jgi:hypothetical protein